MPKTVQAPTATATCVVAGSINIDEFYSLPHIVRPGETISSTGFHRRSGGKGANQAVAAARAMEGSSESAVRLEACIGPDGAEVSELIASSGVDIGGVQVLEGAYTGRAIIQSSADGENSIVLFPGANFSPRTIHPLPPTTTHLVVQNEIPFESTVEYLGMARALTRSSDRKVTTILNPSPMPTGDQLRSLPWGAVDWLLLNEGEAGDIIAAVTSGNEASAPAPSVSTGDMPPPAIHALGTLSLLRSLPMFGTVNVVCTLGAAGVLVYPVSGEPMYRPAARLLNPLKDTTGAGDCFTGYFVAGLLRHRSAGESDVVAVAEVVEECLAACAICVERPGATESLPMRNEVLARMAM